MAARPEFSAYEAALPILGRDGTLAKAVAADSPARGHARGQDRDILRRERARRHRHPDQQGPGRLPRDRLGPSPGLRRIRQQRAARRPQAGTIRLRRHHRGRTSPRQALRSLLRRLQGRTGGYIGIIFWLGCRRRSAEGRCRGQVAATVGSASRRGLVSFSRQQLADRPALAELDRPAGRRGDVLLGRVEAEGRQDGRVDVLDGTGRTGSLTPSGSVWPIARPPRMPPPASARLKPPGQWSRPPNG